MIEEFDFCVGEIVEALKREGLYENTIIIVSSDNAPMIKEGYNDGALENINGHNLMPIYGEKSIRCMREEIKSRLSFPGPVR